MSGLVTRALMAGLMAGGTYYTPPQMPEKAVQAERFDMFAPKQKLRDTQPKVTTAERKGKRKAAKKARKKNR